MIQKSIYIPEVFEKVIEGYNYPDGSVQFAGIKSQGNIISFTDNLDGTYTVLCDDVDGLVNGDWITIDSVSEEFDKNDNFKGDYGNPGFKISSLNTVALTYKIEQVTGYATTTGTWKKNKVYFDFGTIKELNERILDRQSSSFSNQVFPLIYLPMDITEEKGGYTKISTLNNLTVFIIGISDPKKRSPWRLTNVFKPVLNPIYESLINGIAECGLFEENNTEEIEHSKTDRYSWSQDAQTSSLVGEHIDGIEIEFNNLNIKNSALKCLTT